MPPLNWDTFASLPGDVHENFEMLCRGIVRWNFSRYGLLVARAAQPGVEFHLQLLEECALGEPGRWYGWQCRWYDLPAGQNIGATRRSQIEEALRKTEQVLPDLTDWVLWTRHPLTAADQTWYFDLASHMRMHLWAEEEVETYLVGDCELLRRTFFGDLVLRPADLAELRDRALEPIRARWKPDVHQVVDAEKQLHVMLGEVEAWNALTDLAVVLDAEASDIRLQLDSVPVDVRDAVDRLAGSAEASAASLRGAHQALATGTDRDPDGCGVPVVIPKELLSLPRHLRSHQLRAQFAVTNAISSIRIGNAYLEDLQAMFGERLVAILADAGCGKTQLGAQLSAPTSQRPAGLLLRGINLRGSMSQR
jgi:hypothetical protein